MPTGILPSFNLPKTQLHVFDSLAPTRGRDPANRPRMHLAALARDSFLKTRAFDSIHISSPFDGFGDETVVSSEVPAGAALTATAFDLIPFQHADVYLSDANALEWYNHRLEVLRRADLVLSISDYTSSVVCKLLGRTKDSVITIGVDADPIFAPRQLGPEDRLALLARFGIAGEFLIHTGILEERKNVDRLIEAFRLLPAELVSRHQLVLVGPTQPYQREHVRELCRRIGLKGDRIVLLDFVRDDDLAKLYSIARVTVMPSLSEGFGLPLLEAMRCDCAVLGSDATSIPEVIGHSELLFDPYDVGEITHKLEQVLADENFYTFALSHARQQRNRFSWTKVSGSAVEAFEEARRRASKRPRQHAAGKLDVCIRDEERGGLSEQFRTTLRNGERTIWSGPHIDEGGSIGSGIPVLITNFQAADSIAVGAPQIVVGPAHHPIKMEDKLAIYRWFGWDAVKRALEQNDQTTAGHWSAEDVSAADIVAFVSNAGTPSQASWRIRQFSNNRWSEVQDLGVAVQRAWESSEYARLTDLLRTIDLRSIDSNELDEFARVLANNHASTYKQRLFVDIGVLAKKDARSGIQRVVRNLTRELLAVSATFRVEFVYRDGSDYRYARKFVARFLGAGVDPPDTPVDFRKRDIFLGLDLDLEITEEAADALRRHKALGLRVVHVMYDVLPVTRPEWFVLHVPRLFSRWLTLISPIADAILCISKATARELESELMRRSVRPPLLEAFSLGADLDRDIAEEQAAGPEFLPLESWGGREVFLCVGTLEPRKGHKQLIDAFEQLWRSGQDVVLVVVGRRGWNVDAVVSRIESHVELGKRLFWFEGVADVVLVRLYRAATAAILCSEGEGFGLPLIEAARQSVPIIARELAVFREIAGEHAFYFSGEAGADLASALQRWLVLYRANTAPEPHGIDVPTWRDSARALLSLIDQVCTTGNSAP